MNRWKVVMFALIALSLLAGCTSQGSSVPMNYRWANVEGSSLQSAQAGEQFYFNIFVDEGMIKVGQPIEIKLSGDVQSGSLRFELRSPSGQSVWNSGQIGVGDFSIRNSYDLSSGPIGTYQLGIVYSANISATYNLGWQAIRLGPQVLLPGAGMILVALAFVIYADRRQWLGWRYLGLGALFWALTVIAKFAFAISVNPVVYRTLGVSSEQVFSPGNILAYFYIGALTGVFEVGLAYLILRKSRWAGLTWSQALAFGIGFGAIEALLLGVTGLVSALTGLTSPDSLSIPQLGNLANSATIVIALAPVVERLSVIFAHIFACVLIFYAIARGEPKWVWLAIVYKTMLDAPAGFATFWGVSAAGRLWTIEAIIAVFGLIGLWGTIQIGRRYPQVLNALRSSPNSPM